MCFLARAFFSGAEKRVKPCVVRSNFSAALLQQKKKKKKKRMAR